MEQSRQRMEHSRQRMEQSVQRMEQITQRMKKMEQNKTIRENISKKIDNMFSTKMELQRKLKKF